MNAPCPIMTDPRLSDATREEEPEDVSPLTPTEQRIEWLCDAWQEAIADDTYDQWRDVRMMIYGATQTLIQCKNWLDRQDEMDALRDLSSFAFECGLDCLKRGQYEGAPA